MTYCHVSNQIAIHADQPEQRPVCEILSEMVCASGDGGAFIKGEWVEDFRITDLIGCEDLREASLNLMRGDVLAMYNLYIKTLQEFIDAE